MALITKLLKFPDNMAIRSIAYAFLFFALSCSAKKNNEERKGGNKKPGISYSYHIIDSLNMWKLYDSARWIIYEKQSRDTLKWSIGSNEKDSYTFGELGLDLDTLEIRSDTVDFSFCYSLLPKYDCGSPFVGNECIIKTVGVQISTQKFLYCKTACNFDITIGSFFEKRMAENKGLFTSYVNENFDKLNSWFKQELIKRKVISK